MSIKGLAIEPDVEKPNTDSLGGGGFIKATGLYESYIDVAYLGKSRGGAMSLNLHLKLAADKSVIRQTLWVTSGDKKGNKNFYVNKDGKKFLLPGMVLADQIAQITAGKHIGALEPVEKTIKLWDFEASAETPQEVPVLLEMKDKPLYIGLHKCRTNKMVADGSGGYQPTNQERIYNEIDKVFYPDGFSVAEKVAEAEEPTFRDAWLDKYPEDFVKDDFEAVEEVDDSLPEGDAQDTDDLFA